MPASYMEQNQANDVVEYGLPLNTSAILNVLVNKNIIVVQYQLVGDEDPYNTEGLITARTRYSLNFGETWNDITLQTGNHTWSNISEGYIEKFGSNNCLAEFMVRNSTGGKFLLFTPIYCLSTMVNDYSTLNPRRETKVLGWLVHNHLGQLVNGNNLNIMPEQQPVEFNDFTEQLDIGYSPSTLKITDYKGRDTTLGKPFFGYPIATMSDSHYAGSYDAQRVVNRIDSVDYTSNGKRYTIIKRYHNVYIRRGDIVEAQNSERITLGYYVLTLPFIYVFDHTDFNTGSPKLSWVDVLGLSTNLAKLKDYLRPTRYIDAFVKSLISEDREFHNDLQYARGFAKVSGGFTPEGVAVHLSLVFENTAHGELMKVHDREDNKDLLGLIFGNRRYVCTGNPLASANWVLGQVKNHHRHPTEKRAMYYRRLLPIASLDTRHIPGRLYAGGPYGDYGVYYKKYNTFVLTHQNLRLDIASDRVVAFPDRNYSDDADIRYRFAYFIKDKSTGRYSIGIRSKGIDAGVKALTGNQRNGGEHYPLVVNRAIGIGFNTESFIANEPLDVYSNPLLPPDTALVPESSIECSFNVFTMNANGVDDVYDPAEHTESTYCVGMHLAIRATHSATGMTYDLLSDSNENNPKSESCGYVQGGAQPSLAFKLRLMKDLNVKISNSRKYYVLLDCVLTGDNRLIVRPKVTDFEGWDFKITNNTVTVTFLKPQEFGLTTSSATHTLNIGAENIIQLSSNYQESSNPTDWRAAMCEANTYETLGSVGGSYPYDFTAVRNGANVTLRVENGPILAPINNLTINGQVYPFDPAGTVVPYADLAAATQIGID